jgi:hypothetical protein
VRGRRSTEAGTGVGDASRPATSPPLGAGKAETWEFDATEETPRPGALGAPPIVAVGIAAPASPTAAAELSAPAPPEKPEPAARPRSEPAAPTELAAPAERSAPIRVISMKDRTGPRPVVDEARPPLHVQLRAMAEVTGIPNTPNSLGRLAPPRDARQARWRRRRANLAWALVALALAAGIALAIWLIAGR